MGRGLARRWCAVAFLVCLGRDTLRKSAILAPLTHERVNPSLNPPQQPTPRRSRRRWSGSLSCSSPWKSASHSSSFTAESSCSLTKNVHVMALLAPYHLCYCPARPRSVTPSRMARQGPPSVRTIAPSNSIESRSETRRAPGIATQSQNAVNAMSGKGW